MTRAVGSPVIWAIDLAQLCFAWACVIGADLAMKNNAHIEIDIVVRRFPQSVRKFLAILWLIAIAVRFSACSSGTERSSP